jgi:hypothetical protein
MVSLWRILESRPTVRAAAVAAAEERGAPGVERAAVVAEGVLVEGG